MGHADLFYFKTKFLDKVSSDICRVACVTVSVSDFNCSVENLLPNDGPPC